MSLSIHDASVPVLARALTNLSGIVEKGRLHAESEKLDPAILLGMRLYPNMFAFTRQVQVVSDAAKGCMARLAAVEAPKFEDTEASFAELKQRVDKTLAFVQGFDASKLEAGASRAVVVKFPNSTLNFKSGWDYLLTFVLPNVYFHSSMAYGILRHAGVKLGKSDFLGNIGGA
ncbi:MAG TPA: DUF1993 domain-containing protein [Steroidobacteraceae bacterium]|jgi:hypothetical protein